MQGLIIFIDRAVKHHAWGNMQWVKAHKIKKMLTDNKYNFTQISEMLHERRAAHTIK